VRIIMLLLYTYYISASTRNQNCFRQSAYTQTKARPKTVDQYNEQPPLINIYTNQANRGLEINFEGRSALIDAFRYYCRQLDGFSGREWGLGKLPLGTSRAKKWGEMRYRCFGNRNQRCGVWISICFCATVVTAFGADSVARG